MAYMAPVIAGILLAYKGKYLWGSVLTAVALALEIRAGHLQITYYLLIIVVCLLIGMLIKSIREKRFGQFFKASICLIVAAVLGILTNSTTLYANYAFSKEWMKNSMKPHDIPYTDIDTWMNQAMNNVKHLSNSDWHRFFGLLTEKMIKRANKESTEDMVVAAGIILDLCKNADQLDADEREISARRLQEVADHYFTSDKDQYVNDLLLLAAKKLKNEK